ncbi:MAG: hypothetical protein ACR2PG_07650 [Hyphomicrobiaceae bacterium]
MFSIQSIMLMLLGFLTAVLLGFVVAPAYWGRAVRLTTERLRRSLPMTEIEFRAETDNLRAQHAIRVHQLETRVDAARNSTARQRIEINRRDAKISDLSQEVARLNGELETSENARGVLEQTIMDRVPRIEERLSEARQLLFQRDREIAALQTDTSKTYRALDEAMQINAQQRGEIDRLKSSIETRSRRPARKASETNSEEAALRSELEMLRTRTRDQASLISNLQGLVAQRNSRPGGDVEIGRDRVGVKPDAADHSTELHSLNGQHGSQSFLEERLDDAGAQSEALADLREQNARLSGEVEKLSAALTVFEGADNSGKGRPLRDSKIALKARVASLEKETKSQSETIARLRAELAASNDRSARQAANHMDEMRRLGGGQVLSSMGHHNRGAHPYDSRAAGQRNLTERMVGPPPLSPMVGGAEPPALSVTGTEPGKVNGNGPDLTAPQAESSDGNRDAAETPNTDAPGSFEPKDQTAQSQDGGDKNGDETRGGLIRRISGFGKA